VPSGAGAKKLLILAGVGLAVLMLVGFVFGAIGSAMFGTEQFLDKPEIHLSPQPIFPASTRNESLGLVEVGESASEEGHEEEAHFTPMSASKIAVTNTLLSAWFATIVIILFFVLGSRKRSVVPGRFQSVIEVLYEGVLGFCSSVLGPEMARRAFPVIATIFFFVLFNAWLALLPFYQFVGFVQGGEIKAHLLKSAGTDLNMPLALALISFVFVEYYGLRAHGLGYFKKFFAFGKILKGKPSGLIDVFVGFLEGVSELVRVVSFTFRLFGNMTAGEILVIMITFLVPFVATQFVFGLELLVGLIQAVIFASLTVVFLSVAVRHEEH
jgi:F-type H+-transporting ATPase subunit a